MRNYLYNKLQNCSYQFTTYGTRVILKKRAHIPLRFQGTDKKQLIGIEIRPEDLEDMIMFLKSFHDVDLIRSKLYIYMNNDRKNP